MTFVRRVTSAESRPRIVSSSALTPRIVVGTSANCSRPRPVWRIRETSLTLWRMYRAWRRFTTFLSPLHHTNVTHTLTVTRTSSLPFAVRLLHPSPGSNAKQLSTSFGFVWAANFYRDHCQWGWFPLSALTLLVVLQEWHPSCNKLWNLI